MSAEKVNKEMTVELSGKDFFKQCLLKWKWFAISMIFFIGIAVVYVMRKEPVYERSEQLLVKDQDSGGMGNIGSAFSSFGLGGANAGVYNELISLTSPAVMKETVKELRLYMDYTQRNKFRPATLYGNSLPYIVDMKDIGEEESASFHMFVSPDGSMTLKKFIRYTPDGKVKYDGELSFAKNQKSIKTPLGVIEIYPNPEFTGVPFEEETKIVVSKSTVQDAVESYGKKLNGQVVDREADVLDLSIRDVNVQRAVDILNTVLKVYTQYWIDDKNKLAIATSRFIDDRLALIQQELGDVETNIAKYKESTGTISLSATGSLNFQKEASFENRITEILMQISLTKDVKNYLSDPGNKFQVVPLNLGVGNDAIGGNIEQYNQLILTRANLVSNSSENNPIVKDLDSRIAGVREAIQKSINTHLDRLDKELANANKERAKAEGRMLSTPGKILPLLSEERQQKVKENLYVYLLQKREENELSKQFTAENIRVITPPMGSLKPVSPKKKLILLVAFVIAIIIPAGLLYLKLTGDSKVRSKKDFERIKVPFAGEIPLVGKAGVVAGLKDKFGKQKKETAPLAVVEEGKRDVVNEAFRVIRSNIDFMTGKETTGQVIMLTSFNPGSGKSFISYNLGISFALKKKKVLLIDCDLRHGSSSMYVGMPKKGLTQYLTGAVNDWNSVAVASPSSESLHIIPVGKMPPNPAELFENGRLGELIEEARKIYDIILIDCPPVNIVADTQIVAPYADRTMFVVRAGLLEKKALAELNEFYEEKKFKNMSLILNGTEAVNSRYYTYGNYQSFSE